jgi:hypothetical protein
MFTVALDTLPQSWVRKCADSTSVAEKGLVYCGANITSITPDESPCFFKVIL